MREQVLPLVGSHGARAHENGTGAGGDVTFAIDERAERALERFLAERAPGVAFYSEDRGLVEPGSGRADTVLVVDPIDGTRPALAGLESCCVSVAAAPLHEGVTMGDVRAGCLVEILHGTVFLAERGQGLVESPPVRLSPNEDVERMFWTYGFRGRPARPTVAVLGDLIDASSVGGASFDLGSVCFDMARIVTGGLDACVEPGPRLIDEEPSLRARFERVGGGSVLNNSPYDLAAATLVLEEAGGVVTDAYGRSLEDHPLLGSGHEFQMSLVACANNVLHKKLLTAIDAGIPKLSG